MPDFIDEIRKAILRNDYIISRHARARKNQRGITYKEIIQAILQGEVVEQSPNASPYPKCLFMHPVRLDEPLYVACGYNASQMNTVIITVHWFDPEKWTDWRTRIRRQSDE